MSWQDIRQRMLSPIGGVFPHDTSAYGVKRREGTSPHVGIDLNYIGGQDARLNLSHPALRSPVAGIVTNAGAGTVGRIAIRDANGFIHEILHTHTRHVAVGDAVVPGQLIGTMGNTGVKHPNIEFGDHHVHYQMWDPAGNRVNPAEFWDRRDAPAYLGEYQQYLRGRGDNVGNSFGTALGEANMPAAGSLGAPPDGPVPPYAREDFRYLGRSIAGKPESSVFEAGTPSVSYAPPNDVISADRSNVFSDRFGSWTALPVAPFNDGLSPDRQNSFDSRFGNWTSSPAGVTPHNPNLPVRRPNPATPRGMLDDSIPMGGLAGRIAALAGIDPDNPDQPVPPPGGLLKLLLGLAR